MMFARGSAAWLAPPPLVALLLWAIGMNTGATWLAWLALVPALAFLFFCWFFRDPDRVPAAGMASPADGKVTRVDEVMDGDLGQASRICIFMSPIDVHVNRFPVAGEVLSVRHIAGGHIPAFNKDSERNERVETLIQTPHGKVKMIQIAGTVARRIVPYIDNGHQAIKGQRMGLIRFGSRCDVLVPVGAKASPHGAKWKAGPGDKVKAGSTSLAEWPA